MLAGSESIAHMVARRCGLSWSDRAFLCDVPGTGRYEPLSYGWLLEKVLSVAEALERRGVRRGEPVAIMGRNGIEWACCALGVLCSGRVLVPLYAASKPSEISYVLEDSSAALVLADRGGASSLPQEAGVLGFEAALGTFRPGGAGSREVLLERADALARGLERGDVACIVYTSGSLGASKGVVLSHGNVLSNLEGVSRRISLSEDETFLSILPLSHMFEFTAGFMLPIAWGLSILFSGSLSSGEIMRHLRDAGCTIMVGVPKIFQVLKKRIEKRIREAGPSARLLLRLGRMLSCRAPRLGRLATRPLRERLGPSLRYLVVGGAPIHREVVEFFFSLGIPLIQGYGLTEASPVVSMNWIGKENRFGTVGRILDNLECRIERGAAGTREGEILVRGPSVMLGYHRNPEATAETLRDGWLHTGDVGCLDEDGFLVLSGRSKNVIVTPTGKNVYPEELESYFLTSPLFKEACVVAGRDADGGERPFLFVCVDETALPPGVPPREAVNAELARMLPALSDYKRPCGWRIVEGELPKTVTHKVRRNELKALLG